MNRSLGNYTSEEIENLLLDLQDFFTPLDEELAQTILREQVCSKNSDGCEVLKAFLIRNIVTDKILKKNRTLEILTSGVNAQPKNNFYSSFQPRTRENIQNNERAHQAHVPQQKALYRNKQEVKTSSGHKYHK